VIHLILDGEQLCELVSSMVGKYHLLFALVDTPQMRWRTALRTGDFDGRYLTGFLVLTDNHGDFDGRIGR